MANRICQLTTLIVLRILWDNLAATGVHSRLNFSFFFFCQTTDVGDVSAEIVGWQETKSKWLEGWLELGDGKHSLFRIPDFWTGCLVLGKKLHSTKNFFIKASYDGLYDSANPVGQPRNAKFQWVFQSGFPGSTLAVYRVHHDYWKKTDNLGSDGIQSQTWNRYTKQGLSALAHLWDKKDKKISKNEVFSPWNYTGGKKISPQRRKWLSSFWTDSDVEWAPWDSFPIAALERLKSFTPGAWIIGGIDQKRIGNHNVDKWQQPIKATTLMYLAESKRRVELYKVIILLVWTWRPISAQWTSCEPEEEKNHWLMKCWVCVPPVRYILRKEDKF